VKLEITMPWRTGDTFIYRYKTGDTRYVALDGSLQTVWREDIDGVYFKVENRRFFATFSEMEHTGEVPM
jgi:hypothetical protein